MQGHFAGRQGLRRTGLGIAGLRIMCRLNGEVLQDGNADDMIFDTATLVSTLSEVITLKLGVGFARKPPVWMKPGDVCEIEIEKIGLLRNPEVAEGG